MMALPYIEPRFERIFAKGGYGYGSERNTRRSNEKKNLPKLGQTVRSKKYGTLWRVIETKENWQTIPDDPAIGGYRMAPGIYITYWRIKEGEIPGTGKVMGYTYTLHDYTFEANWEIVEEE